MTPTSTRTVSNSLEPREGGIGDTNTAADPGLPLSPARVAANRGTLKPRPQQKKLSIERRKRELVTQRHSTLERVVAQPIKISTSLSHCSLPRAANKYNAPSQPRSRTCTCKCPNFRPVGRRFRALARRSGPSASRLGDRRFIGSAWIQGV